MNVAVRGQELIDPLGLMCREVVGNHMNFLATWLVDYDVDEEGDELRRRVPLSGLAQYLTGLGVEGGVQRQRAMAKVLEAMPLGVNSSSPLTA